MDDGSHSSNSASSVFVCEQHGASNGSRNGSSNYIRDRLVLKRNIAADSLNWDSIAKRLIFRSLLPSKWHDHRNPSSCRSSTFSFYFLPMRFIRGLTFVVCILILVSWLFLSSTISTHFNHVSNENQTLRRGFLELQSGSMPKFYPGDRLRFLIRENAPYQIQFRQSTSGLRALRVAIILGNARTNPQSLLLVTVVKNLELLGYEIKMFAVAANKRAYLIWEQVGFQLSVLQTEQLGNLDWSIFEGIIVDSLEARNAISCLIHEPFVSIPVIWIIQEDTLANRLPLYKQNGLHLIFFWRSLFDRADVVLFPDFSLPMRYGLVDSGNFFVIPCSPNDVWIAESFARSHSQLQLRSDAGFAEDGVLVLIIQSSFFSNITSLSFPAEKHALELLLSKYSSRGIKFVLLLGHYLDGEAVQGVNLHMKLPNGTMENDCFDMDLNGILLMADIVIYASFLDEQGFPALILRAMSFGLPIVAPDIPTISKYAKDRVHAVFFNKFDANSLTRAFSLLVSDGKLSEFASSIASAGKFLSRDMLAPECIDSYADLLEHVLNFPSDVFLPFPVSSLKQKGWEWDLFDKAIKKEKVDSPDYSVPTQSCVFLLEESHFLNQNLAILNEADIVNPGIPTEMDWRTLKEMEDVIEHEKLELAEVEERTERNVDSWDDIYQNAKKSEKLMFELDERDEGELERTGQPVCIYEIYHGTGAWPFLHHSSLYRGLSLSSVSRRARSDDVDAVSRLPLLNDSHYLNVLCEMGGMFSIANRVDDIHKRPWIGFQSWKTSGRNVSLSNLAAQSVQDKIQKDVSAGAMYFWAPLDLGQVAASNKKPAFWPMCDILNRGNCREVFQATFRHMYNLPSDMEALPPLPGSGRWSALNSWVMPTNSFLEFVMFSRMFVDSLDALRPDASGAHSCPLSSSRLEAKHCYCRLLDLLVNVWAYHSGLKMVYIDPHTGSMEEQHEIGHREGIMWRKYFDPRLLKSMDEDLAEAADDGDHPREKWLWPLTGEVHWQGVFERERVERYRTKMDKKRKLKEKLYERMKGGYKQKPLGK